MDPEYTKNGSTSDPSDCNDGFRYVDGTGTPTQNPTIMNSNDHDNNNTLNPSSYPNDLPTSNPIVSVANGTTECHCCQ